MHEAVLGSDHLIAFFLCFQSIYWWQNGHNKTGRMAVWSFISILLAIAHYCVPIWSHSLQIEASWHRFQQRQKSFSDRLSSNWRLFLLSFSILPIMAGPANWGATSRQSRVQRLAQSSHLVHHQTPFCDDQFGMAHYHPTSSFYIWQRTNWR